MNYVNLDSVIAEAISVVGVGVDEELMAGFARQWVWTAVCDLPVTEDNIKVCEITNKNFTLKKPDDMRRFLEIALYDSSDRYIPHVFHAGKKRIYPDYRIFPAATNNPDHVNCVPVDLSEDQFAFYIGSNGTTVSYAKVRYFAYPLDKDGMPLIRQDDVLTCIYYVRFMASLRKNDNRSEIQQNELLYKAEADRARAKRKSQDLSTDKLKTISGVMNRMIPSFSKSVF